MNMPVFMKGVNAQEKLKEVCQKAYIDKDMHNSLEGFDRLIEELKVIDSKGFADYFLIVADIVRFCESKGWVVGPGRGSAPGSVVAYLTGITKVDPTEYGLSFRRFLDKDRDTLPDIDLDIPSSKRKYVIKYLVNRYGNEHVAEMSTIVTKPNGKKEFRKHPCGIVISDKPLTEIEDLKLEYNKGMFTIKEDPRIVQEKFAKFDLLPSKMMDKLTDAKEEGIKIDFEGKFDSKRAWNLINTKENDLFQSGISFDNVVVNIKPTTIEDLALCLAMMRPGCDRKLFGIGHTELKDVPRSCFGDIVDRTGSVLVYQEQLIEIFLSCGLDASIAFKLLRSLMKSKSDIINEYGPVFLKKASEQMGSKLAEELYEYIVVASSYLFVKAHAISYAKIMYMDAYVETRQ